MPKPRYGAGHGKGQVPRGFRDSAERKNQEATDRARSREARQQARGKDTGSGSGKNTGRGRR